VAETYISIAVESTISDVEKLAEKFCAASPMMAVPAGTRLRTRTPPE
jgi:hypothetical protein